MFLRGNEPNLLKEAMNPLDKRGNVPTRQKRQRTHLIKEAMNPLD